LSSHKFYISRETNGLVVSQFWEASVWKAQFWAQRLCQSCSQCMVAPPLSWHFTKSGRLLRLAKQAQELFQESYWPRGEARPRTAEHVVKVGELFNYFWFVFLWISVDFFQLDISGYIEIAGLRFRSFKSFNGVCAAWPKAQCLHFMADLRPEHSKTSGLDGILG